MEQQYEPAGCLAHVEVCRSRTTSPHSESFSVLMSVGLFVWSDCKSQENGNGHCYGRDIDIIMNIWMDQARGSNILVHTVFDLCRRSAGEHTKGYIVVTAQRVGRPVQTYETLTMHNRSASFLIWVCSVLLYASTLRFIPRRPEESYPSPTTAAHQQLPEILPISKRIRSCLHPLLSRS